MICSGSVCLILVGVGILIFYWPSSRTTTIMLVLIDHLSKCCMEGNVGPRFVGESWASGHGEY